MRTFLDKRVLVEQIADEIGLVTFEWFLPLTIQGNGTEEQCDWLASHVSFRLLIAAYHALWEFRNWEEDQENQCYYAEPHWFKFN